VGTHDKEHEVGVVRAQDIDTLSGIQAYAAVRDHGEARHALLPQLHDLLRERQLEVLAAGVLLVEAPGKAHRRLTDHRTARVLLFHIRHPSPII